MKKILVPIDFSPASRTAGEYAAGLAKVLKLPLELLHVYLAPATPLGEPGVWAGAVIELQEEEERKVREEMDFLREKYGIKISGEAREGLKGEMISLEAKESEAGLVVMGMKAEKKQRFLRSTVFTAIRKTRIPVLVVPEGQPVQPIRNIVLAVDFEGVRNEDCFDALFALTDSFKATLQVLHVAGKAAEVKEEELSGKLQLARILAKETYWYHQLDENNVEESILQFTDRHPADLLVMVAHRHNFFERVFGTVYTRSVGYKTPVPLLVLEDQER